MKEKRRERESEKKIMWLLNQSTVYEMEKVEIRTWVKSVTFELA